MRKTYIYVFVTPIPNVESESVNDDSNGLYVHSDAQDVSDHVI